MKPAVPFSLIPPRALFAAGKKYAALGIQLTRAFSELKTNLAQAEMEIAAAEYAAASLVSAALNTAFILILILFFGYLASANVLTAALALALVTGASSFLTAVYYPKIIALRRKRKLEDNLVPAVRQLVIELKSGVPLFEAMTSVCDDYGEVSEEFKKIVKKINAGEAEIDVLGDASRRLPSVQFQKVIWQISNALKVGSDVSNALEAILEDLTAEKINEIKRYSQELSPWTMVYMMTAVILPSLGITLGIVILSFLSVSVPRMIFAVAIVFLVIFQLFFMNFLGTRRPAI
ncbi:MAG: type II secretion system F family protein [Candidatus Micrarchaeota archaeon]|nr:type II secretion system F family protein [Candidatus Micrarchaeota archaeon]